MAIPATAATHGRLPTSRAQRAQPCGWSSWGWPPKGSFSELIRSPSRLSTAGSRVSAVVTETATTIAAE